MATPPSMVNMRLLKQRDFSVGFTLMLMFGFASSSRWVKLLESLRENVEPVDVDLPLLSDAVRTWLAAYVAGSCTKDSALAHGRYDDCGAFSRDSKAEIRKVPSVFAEA